MAHGIPITYVPARNTVFLSFALAWAETLGASDIFIGVNALDYSGYPDCRPEYIAAFEAMANLATKAGVEGHAAAADPCAADADEQGADRRARVCASASTIRSPAAATTRRPMAGPAAACDSCLLRAKGFAEAGVADPLYRPFRDGLSMPTQTLFCGVAPASRRPAMSTCCPPATARAACTATAFWPSCAVRCRPAGPLFPAARSSG